MMKITVDDIEKQVIYKSIYSKPISTSSPFIVLLPVLALFILAFMVTLLYLLEFKKKTFI